jgi:predicted nucleic acid-binding protein
LSVFVVDAAVVAKWFVPEPLWRESRRLLDPRHDLACPDLLWPEIGRLLWKKSRRGELHSREAVRILRAIGGLPLDDYPSEPLLEGALEIALVTGRTVYDCVYLALAVALDGRMVTADQRLVNSLAGTPLSTHVVWVGAATA